MHIDFLIGDNPYQSTAIFAEEFSQALERMGVISRCFYIGDGNFYKAFYAIISDPPDLTCSFSDVTVGQQESLGDAWQIPHLSMLIDPAIYFLHLRRGQYSLLSSCDREDVQLLGPKAFFLPHGVERALNGEADKIYDIAFFGSCHDPEDRIAAWQQEFSRDTIEKLEAAADLVLAAPSVSCLRALGEVGLEENLPRLHAELDALITARDRIALIQALNCPVHLFGQGPWKKFLPNCICHGPLSFAEARKKMGQSKIVLNSSPRFKNGSHERLFLTPMLGAGLVTGQNAYIQEVFGQLPLAYPCGEYEEGAHLVYFLLSNEKVRSEQVQAAREIVLKGHTWDARSATLMGHLKQ